MSWIRVEKPREIKGLLNGKIIAVLDLQVSTAEDLPAIGDVVENYIVAAGSIAQIIESGQWATLNDDGKWYAADGSGEVSTEAASTLSAPLALGKTVKPAVIEPESFEPESFEPDELKEQEIEEEETESEPTESEVTEDA